MTLVNRLSSYGAISTELALLNDQRLMPLLENAEHHGKSIGGKTALLDIAGHKVFVKKIKLTDIERQPEHIMSTANFFKLPLYYQYGVGSTGFGAWRELSAHIMSTNWVIAGECPNFPLMYHWRILPSPMMQPSTEATQELEQEVTYWNNSSTVHQRLHAIQNASAEIVLFLEYFPENVYQWLGQELTKDSKSAEAACTMVDHNLSAINNFINSRGFIHFDAHVWNILTDGTQLYLSDFGLALSSQFELTDEERDFFKTHQYYDQCTTAFFLTNFILEALLKQESCPDILSQYQTEEYKKLISPPIDKIISRCMPISQLISDFFKQLKITSKLTPYPADELNRLVTTTNPIQKPILSKD